jgi:hypothetical protein
MSLKFESGILFQRNTVIERFEAFHGSPRICMRGTRSQFEADKYTQTRFRGRRPMDIYLVSGVDKATKEGIRQGKNLVKSFEGA